MAEARRAVSELGMKAIFLRPNIYNGRPWHDTSYDPLWTTCQELNVPIGFHETTGSRMKAAGADRFKSMGIAHISTHSVEQMLACMDVIMGGVTERFPRLRFAFLEGQCGWLPFWLHRMDEHHEWREPYGEMTHLSMKPSEYFRRQGFCAVECDEEQVPGRHEPLPRAPARRPEQEEDPLGQRAPALQPLTPATMRIGFIGVGNIGQPMAGQLLAAGHALVVHDVRREAAADLLAAGADWAESPADLAARSEVVATCLPGPVEMEAVCLGPRGLLEGITPGALYVDHTTNSPLLVRRVQATLATKGVAMLDAPVSGGMEGARTRDLLVMVGGERAVFERARPVLDAVARRVLYTGGIGSGSIAKLMHNCASFTLDLVMAECWTVGVKAGIAPEVIVDVFNQAALGHMMSLKVRLPATYLRGNFEPRFSLRLARNDLGLALELARATDVPMRLSALCEQEMVEAIGRGWANRRNCRNSANMTVEVDRWRRP